MTPAVIRGRPPGHSLLTGRDNCQRIVRKGPLKFEGLGRIGCKPKVGLLQRLKCARAAPMPPGVHDRVMDEHLILRRLSRRRERDDRGLGKLSAPLPDIDSIEESSSIIAEAQERDAADERRLDDLLRSDRPGLINGSRPMGSNVKAMRQCRLRLE
jgi:hypothetical protein